MTRPGIEPQSPGPLVNTLLVRLILMQFLSSFFSVQLVSVHVVHLYCRIDTAIAWKKLFYFIG